MPPPPSSGPRGGVGCHLILHLELKLAWLSSWSGSQVWWIKFPRNFSNLNRKFREELRDVLLIKLLSTLTRVRCFVSQPEPQTCGGGLRWGLQTLALFLSKISWFSCPIPNQSTGIAILYQTQVLALNFTFNRHHSEAFVCLLYTLLSCLKFWLVLVEHRAKFTIFPRLELELLMCIQNCIPFPRVKSEIQAKQTLPIFECSTRTQIPLRLGNWDMDCLLSKNWKDLSRKYTLSSLKPKIPDMLVSSGCRGYHSHPPSPV